MTGRRRSVVMRAAFAAAVASAIATPGIVSAQDAPAGRVQYGVTQSADTVTVGDPFRLVVRVRAPLGSVIEFPAGPDSTGPVQMLDPAASAASADRAAVDQTAAYRMAAWDVGTLPIALGELVVRSPAGVQRVVVPVESVHVRSVLPADSSQRVPKPVRPIFETRGFPSWIWLLLAAAVLLLLLGYWWWRRRRRPSPAAAGEDAFARAQAEFERVERLGLIEVGERGRYVALVVEVLRDYLEARHPDARLSHTSTELLLALRGRENIPSERLGAVLAESDLVKFARRPVSPDRARQLGSETRAIVQAVEEAVRRALAAEAAAQRERDARAARTRPGKEAA